MKGARWGTGKFLQLTGLVVLPMSLWVGFYRHNEKGSLLIFISSVAVFWLGTLLTRDPAKL